MNITATKRERDEEDGRGAVQGARGYPKDIDMWHAREGKFCSGSVEGKIKEHARRASTKPLAAEKPGENGVGDLMFIEGRNEVKTPFYLNVDVATKLIMGYAMMDKTYGEVVRESSSALRSTENHRLSLLRRTSRPAE